MVIVVIMALVLLGNRASMSARIRISATTQSTKNRKTGVTHAKNRILIAIANPAWSTMTRINNILLAFASVALKTGYRFLRRKKTVQPKPTPTSAQFSAVNGLQLTRATAIQIKFEYPYNAQHSIRSAVELPNHLSAPHSAIGMIPVYP